MVIISGSLPVGASVELECMSRQGAALVIKHHANREDTSCKLALREYMLKNYKSWFAFIRNRLKAYVQLSDLILVTGCDMTADWATAVFVSNATKASIAFNVGDSMGSAQAAAWGSWNTSRAINVPNRCGPQSSAGLTSSASSGDLVPRRDINENADFNQCIFIRGFRVKERLFFSRKLVAAAGYCELERRDETGEESDLSGGPMASESDEQDDIEIESIPGQVRFPPAWIYPMLIIFKGKDYSRNISRLYFACEV